MMLTRFPSWTKSVTAVTVSAAAAQLLPEQGARSRSTWHAERAMFGGPSNWLSKMNMNTESDKSYPNSCSCPVYHPTQTFHIPGHTRLETRWGLHEDSCDWLSLACLCTFYCAFIFSSQQTVYWNSVVLFFPQVLIFLEWQSYLYGSMPREWRRVVPMTKKEMSLFLENISLSLALL